MTSQRLTFEGSTGDALSARLDLPPDAAPIAYALFAHCFTCSKNLKAVVNISRALNRARVAVLRFDFTGLGESEGDFAETGFSSNVGDLVAAAKAMASDVEAPRMLIGHSLGGAAVIQAAAEIPSAKAVATIGAPAEPAHVRHLLTSSLDEIEARGEAEVTIAGRSFTIRKEFLDDLDESGMRHALAGLGRALLVLHSPIDEVVGIENAESIFKAARHPKSYVSLDRADHLLTDERDSSYVGEVVAAWARRYIGRPEPRPTVETDAEGGVVASVGPRGFRTEIVAGGHCLVADEPVSVGGTDTGPTPYDLLAASLGACTCMTLRLYADRKEWPLERVTTRLRHRKVHAEDDRDPDSDSSKMDEIELRLDVEGELDADQRARLLEIAGRCPVHRTLDAGVRMPLALADGS